MSARIERLLRARADRTRVPILQSFCKTGPGQYAEGDVFIGVTVPDLRRTCRECADATVDDRLHLLRSPVHEERALALLLMVDAFKRADDAGKRHLHRVPGRIRITSTTGTWSTARQRRSSARGFRI
jgi:hypothetical protein